MNISVEKEKVESRREGKVERRGGLKSIFLFKRAK